MARITTYKDAISFLSEISSADLNSYFENFNTAVSNKQFERVDYQTWKRFKTFANPNKNHAIQIKWNHDFVKNHFDIDLYCSDIIETIHLTCSDNSLGSYFLETFIHEQIIDEANLYGVPVKNPDGCYRDDVNILIDIYVIVKTLREKPVINQIEINPDGLGMIIGKYEEPSLSSTIAKIDNNVNYKITMAYDSLQEQLDNCITEIDNIKLDLACKEDKKITINNTKEKNNMNSMFNFDFGPVSSSTVRMSMYGLAVKNKDGKYVSYNAASEEIFDVEILNFDGAKFLYKMPVAIKDIAVGDIVIHNHIPMFVISIPKDGKTLKVVDPVNGEKKEVMLTKSPFGFNFATKVVNFLAGAFDATNVSENNPFGNMWMLAALGNNKDISEFLPLMMMSGSNMNPQMMLPLMMMGDSKSSAKDILPMMMFMNMNGCTCGCAGSKTGGTGSGT